MKENIEKRLIAILILVSVVIACMAAVAVSNIRKSGETSDWVNHTHAVILEADGVVSSLNAGQAALHAFLFAGDARDQAAYRTFFSETLDHLDVAKTLSHDNPRHAAVFSSLETNLTACLEKAKNLVAARQAGNLEGAKAALGASAGFAELTEIRRLVEKLKTDENELLHERDKTAYLQAQTTKWVVLSGVAMNLALLILGAWLVKDDLAARRRAAKALEDANAVLETKVRERTAELVQANTALTQENLERRWSNQALEHQLKYSQLIVDSIGDVVFVISKALNITRTNPAAVHMTGMQMSELIGITLDVILKPDVPSASAGAPGTNPISQAMRDGHEIQDRPATLLRKGGGSLPIRFSVCPLRDQDKVVGAVVVARSLDENRFASSQSR